MATTLTLDHLAKAMAEGAAAFRCRRHLQPAAGEGTKIFPPTYAGATYAVELRRQKGESIPCVLIDSVQSQANRMEESLQQAVDDGRITLPVVEVEFSDKQNELRKKIDRITSLTAPHRLADVILRDSLLKGSITKFSESEFATQWRMARTNNATSLFNLCPTGLVFGMWGSPDKPGGLGPKFERAIVSEIVGINCSVGIVPTSRLDPLSIQREAGPVYRTPDGDWTLDPQNAKKDPKGKPILFAKSSKKTDVSHDPSSDKYPDQGRPSVINHGNVTPAFKKYSRGVEGPDLIAQPHVQFDYVFRDHNGQIASEQSFQGSVKQAREGEIGPGGVTVDYCEQTTTLSLIALRRLRFPDDAGQRTSERDHAAQTVLAALGLCAAALAADEGLNLRSRCLLWPEAPMAWELLAKPGEAPQSFSLDAGAAVDLLNHAVEAAKKAGVTWHDAPIKLAPSKNLIELVARSQALEAAVEGESE